MLSREMELLSGNRKKLQEQPRTLADLFLCKCTISHSRLQARWLLYAGFSPLAGSERIPHTRRRKKCLAPFFL